MITNNLTSLLLSTIILWVISSVLIYMISHINKILSKCVFDVE